MFHFKQLKNNRLVMIEAITPEEAVAVEGRHIPDFIVESFNTLIKEKFRQGRACITKDEVVIQICKVSEYSRQHIIDKGWLDVEPLFRAQGWEVRYSSPDRDESFDAYYVFTIKR